MRTMTRIAGRTIASVLFPDTCLACRMHVAERGTLCPDCWSKLHFIAEPICDVTGALFQHEFGERMVSAEALAFINRLSDWLFVAGRAANGNGADDIKWVPGANR